jgi:drug/metabolite transporter (DMT)-like permease
LYGSGLSAGVIVTLRAAMAAVVLFAALAVLRPTWLRVRLRDIPYFAAYGLVSVAAYNLLYFLTIQRIPVAAASVLLYTAPAFVAVVAYLTLGEPLTRSKLLALAFTLAGCALVARAYEPETFKGQALGLLTGLGAGFTYGMYGIFGKHALKRYNPWVVQAYSLLAGCVPLLLLYGRDAATALVRSPQVLPAVAYLSLVPTLGAYGLYLTGLQSVEASHASILSTVEPVVAALLGFWILHEPLNLPQAAGIVLVLASAVILNASAEAARAEHS